MSKGELVSVEYPDLWVDLRHSIHQGADGNGKTHLTRDEMVGFEDIIPNGFGEGYYYNTSPSISQLVVALSIAPNPDIAEIVFANNGNGTRALVEKLRRNQVLDGQRILDLGCGLVPGFAIASKSLGAEVHTVDGEPLEVDMATWVNSHTMTDLLDPSAIKRIAETTGGEFDFTTSNIIGAVPHHPQWEVPGEVAIRKYAEELLKPGGYHYYTGRPLVQKESAEAIS